MSYCPYMDNVSSPYGAPMGRHSDSPSQFTGKTHLRKVPMVDLCYDPGGAYWGMGTQLWCAWDEELDIVTYFRSPSRADAKRELPNARFYR
jgi:hypothetical protein